MALQNILLSFGDEAKDIQGIDILAALQEQHEAHHQEAEFQPAEHVAVANM